MADPGVNGGVRWTCAGFFFFIFLSLELVGSCGGGEAEHGGAGLEAEVLGGEFGPRTPLCSMEQRHGGELCSGEEDGFDGD